MAEMRGAKVFTIHYQTILIASAFFRKFLACFLASQILGHVCRIIGGNESYEAWK